MFIDNVKNTLNEEFNYAQTENGALVYRTSGKELVDLNFAVASLRSAPESSITYRFTKAFYEDPIMAMKWLFYCRDVRGGLGERRLFNVVMNHLSRFQPELVRKVLGLVPEYGRWDDLINLLDSPHFKFKDDVIALIRAQLILDLKNRKQNKPISLLAKWLPSSNSSSKKTARLAEKIYRDGLGMSECRYRKTLSNLRSYINIVEQKMTNDEWGSIDYQAVPSRANIIYNNAFLRHDEKRRREFLDKVKEGKEKINASTLYPHDIVHKYAPSPSWKGLPTDDTLEALWKALPDTVKGCGNTIVVADGSGSMRRTIGNTRVTALSVANALAIYFAERSSGQFKDKYITFSMRPQLVDFSNCENLSDKIVIASAYNEVANTNIHAVFNLILQTAVKHNMAQSELPANVLIISDMEFDCATYGQGINERLFNNILGQYTERGYKLPRLVFWNVNSRTMAIPVKENDLGVALVSGFSTNIVKMVMSNKTDPYDCLLETLNDERYKAVENALTNE